MKDGCELGEGFDDVDGRMGGLDKSGEGKGEWCEGGKGWGGVWWYELKGGEGRGGWDGERDGVWVWEDGGDM